MIVSTITVIDGWPVSEYGGVVIGERFWGPTSLGVSLQA
jgi:uncharacterized protein YbjQ (UPF0145 family)